MAKPDVSEKFIEKESYRWPVPGKPSLFVDMRALNGDKLSVRYRTSNLYRYSPTQVSPVAKAVVLDLITRREFRPDLFRTLPAEEKRKLEQFIHVIGYDDIEGYDGPMSLKDLRTNLEIYKGQLDAGNSNPKIKQAMRDTIAELGRLKHLTAGQSKAMIAQYA